MKSFDLEGVIPAMVTPFTRGGKSVNYDLAVSLALYLAEKGVHGLFLCGTTGEGMLMSLDERKKLLEEVNNAVGKKLKVIAHTGCLDFISTLDLTEHAAAIGACAAGIVTPAFYSYDAEAIYSYYSSLAKAVNPFPILLYNLPSCAKNVLRPSLVARLSQDLSNIVGIKDSGSELQAQFRMVTDTHPDFAVINGCDEYTFHALVGGAKGSVSSTANVIPEVFLGVYSNVKKNNFKKALEYQAKLSKATEIFHYGAMVAYYKEGLRLRGVDPGFVRSPQRELTKSEKNSFASKLEKLQII